MAYDSSNVFAKILDRQLPCDKVFEDDKVLAFHDISPKKKFHIIVIPKSQFRNFDEYVLNTPQDEVGHFFSVIKKIVMDLKLHKYSGYRLIINQGKYGGQEVDHFHVHILGGEHVGPMVAA